MIKKKFHYEISITKVTNFAAKIDYAILSARRSIVKIKSLQCRIVLMQSANLETPSTMTKKLQKEEEKGKSKKGLGEQREQKRMDGMEGSCYHLRPGGTIKFPYFNVKIKSHVFFI